MLPPCGEIIFKAIRRGQAVRILKAAAGPLKTVAERKRRKKPFTFSGVFFKIVRN
jgi:hypothetical protein